jgi:hypothetical protein
MAHWDDVVPCAADRLASVLGVAMVGRERPVPGWPRTLENRFDDGAFVRAHGLGHGGYGWQHEQSPPGPAEEPDRFDRFDRFDPQSQNVANGHGSHPSDPHGLLFYRRENDHPPDLREQYDPPAPRDNYGAPDPRDHYGHPDPRDQYRSPDPRRRHGRHYEHDYCAPGDPRIENGRQLHADRQLHRARDPVPPPARPPRHPWPPPPPPPPVLYDRNSDRRYGRHDWRTHDDHFAQDNRRNHAVHRGAPWTQPPGPRGESPRESGHFRGGYGGRCSVRSPGLALGRRSRDDFEQSPQHGPGWNRVAAPRPHEGWQAPSWSELRERKGCPKPTQSEEERRLGRAEGDSLAVVPSRELCISDVVHRAEDNDIYHSISAFGVAVYARSQDLPAEDDSWKSLVMYFVPETVAREMSAPSGWYCIARPGDNFVISVKAIGALPVERTLDNMQAINGKMNDGVLDDTLFCNLWLDNRRVSKCNTAFNTLPLYAKDVYPLRQVVDFVGYETQRSEANDAALLSNSCVRRFAFKSMEFGEAGADLDAVAEHGRRTSKFGDYPGTIRLVMRTSRRLAQREANKPNCNRDLNLDTGEARRTILSKREVGVTGRLGADQTGAPADMPVYSSCWVRSKKVERPELGICIYFRERTWLESKGLIAEGGDDFLPSVGLTKRSKIAVIDLTCE